MARGANKTVRFTQVVERSGQPHVHTLWMAPEKDAEFKRAREGHRLMTIESGSISGKADVGFVGFDSAHREGGQFLIFPQSLKRFEGARVIGIKFDLIEQPPLAPVKKMKSAKPSREKARPKVAFRLPPREEQQHKQAERNDVEVAASVASQTLPEKKLPVRKQPEPSLEKTAARKPSAEYAALVKQVRAAMKDLQHDKPRAAYQRLKRTLAGEP